MNEISMDTEQNDNENVILDLILHLMQSQRVFSDIQFGTNDPVRVKTVLGWVNAETIVDDQYLSSFAGTVSATDMINFVKKIDENYLQTLKERDLNRPYNLSKGRLRVHVYLAKGGEQIRVAIRRVNKVPPKLSHLGLPPSVELLTQNQSGIILISGATGSGKTTTLASILQEINHTRNCHIVTIEDPIEYEFEADKAFFSQREIGIDCTSFSSGLISALRQRPDVIVIGEIRDRETAEQALLAGESGHLVIGTLHANSAVGTITKMMGFFNGNEKEARLNSLSASLIGIINQVLLPPTNGETAVLAVDLLANHTREYSNHFNNPDVLQSTLDNTNDHVSVSIGSSLKDLVLQKKITRAAALAVVQNNKHAYDMIKNLGS